MLNYERSIYCFGLQAVKKKKLSLLMTFCLHSIFCLFSFRFLSSIVVCAFARLFIFRGGWVQEVDGDCLKYCISLLGDLFLNSMAFIAFDYSNSKTLLIFLQKTVDV